MTTTPSHPAADPAPRSAPAEVLGVLNELLEAERAGARVARETGLSINTPELSALVDDIHQDELRWCSMLMRTIKAWGATPSSATGAFYGKAMAINDLDDRLKFLNRGQAWVVRKLEALLPGIDDEAVRAELNAMLQAHHHNISRVEARYAAQGPGATAPAAAPR